MTSYRSRLEEAAQRLVAPSFAKDQIFIMENFSFSQSFPDARPISIRVNRYANLARHPLEDGTIISEHLVIEPTTIEIAMIFIQSFRDTYAKIKAAFETATIFTIQTKTHSYNNMVITDLPLEESTDYWDVVLVKIRFQEARQIGRLFGMLNLNNVQNSADASTQNLGSLQSTLLTQADTLLASALYKNAKG